MRIAMEDLGLEQIVVLYPGDQEYELGENVRVVPLSFLPSGYKSLFPRGRRRWKRK
jgi:hypothetical protein